MANRTVTSLPVTELSVAEGNWDTSRNPINQITIHTMVGTVGSANSRFNTPNQASAHYGVALDGRLYHWVDEDNTAYHAGNYSVNQESIGIEHEDNGDYNGSRTPQLYETSAKLVADICQFYSIPCDRDHILKHKEVSIAPTACPDSLDIDHIIAMANALLNPTQTTPDWQKDLHQIPQKTLTLTAPLKFQNITTGEVLKTFKKGETIRVDFATKNLTTDYLMTAYSAQHLIPNGFVTVEFDDQVPAKPVPQPTPSGLPEPTKPPKPSTDLPPGAVIPDSQPLPEGGDISLNTKDNTWSSFLASLRSRKFLLAVTAAFVAGGNAFFGWHLTTEQVLTIIAPLLTFVGFEGAADAMERKALASNPGDNNTSTTVVNAPK